MSERPLVEGGFIRRHPVLSAGGLIVVLALVAALLIWEPWRTTRVSSDAYDFGIPALDGVTTRMNDENQRVARSGRPFVTIAHALTIRRDPGDPIPDDQVRHELQGAYLAQFRINHPNGDPATFADVNPLVKLALVDTGPMGGAESEAVAQLDALPSSENLVAVTGLGPSRVSTQALINDLSDRTLTTVSSILTAGNIGGRYMVRTAPTNQDQVGAVLWYLSKQSKWIYATDYTPLLAYLVRDSSITDNYSGDLADSYRRSMPPVGPRRLIGEGQYDGSKGGTSNLLDRQVDRICATGTSVVFFAGRAGNLEDFLRHVGARPCAATQPLTVVTADSANSVATANGRAEPIWRPEGNLDVIYSTLAVDTNWTRSPGSFPVDASSAFGDCPYCYGQLFHESLLDGYAIMGHDAVLTAELAAQNGAPTSGASAPGRDEVANGVNGITPTSPVQGSSGWIYYDTSFGHPQGLAIDKAVPIMRLTPDGRGVPVDLLTARGTIPTRPR